MDALSAYPSHSSEERRNQMPLILLWLLGVPLGLVVILWLLGIGH